MNNKIFIVDGYRYLIWWKVSIITYIIHCEILNIVTMSYQNLIVYYWKMMTFIIILSRIFSWVDITFSKIRSKKLLY